MNKRVKIFAYADNVILKAIVTQVYMKIHLAMAGLVVIAGFALKISATEWILCCICFAMVFTAELINTAIENVDDMISPEWCEITGNLKDMSAGAVSGKRFFLGCRRFGYFSAQNCWLVYLTASLAVRRLYCSI
ncbi:MAG: diacylglycerol kinase family protein [Prolixibacteraceae bacterium]|nr:diacylglycerol kinase family protein [Prolixibacteraceae bacterium]